MLSRLIEMESVHLKYRESLQKNIVKTRSDLTDKYDPNLPGPAMSAAKAGREKSGSRVMGKLR